MTYISTVYYKNILCNIEMNIVLDIDETLIHFLPKPAAAAWDSLSAAEKKKYETVKMKDGLAIKRPGLNEFLDFLGNLVEAGDARVFIWTWSSATYAKEVVSRIVEPRVQVTAILSSEDSATAAAIYGNTKDLRYLYEMSEGSASPANTVLVDDMHVNTLNVINRRNTVTVPAFALWGRSPERNGPYEAMSEDRALGRVAAIVRRLVAAGPAPREMPALSFKRISTLGLARYMSSFHWGPLRTPVHAIAV
jgi:hypothetical protein